MQFGFTFRKAAEFGICIVAITTLTLAGCGGGSNTASQQIYTYTASAGVGEVLKFTINTTNLVYSYSVLKSSYAASGVTEGQNSFGSLTDIGNGFYTVEASNDNFIQGGKLFPGNGGLLSGHVRINTISGSSRIPVIGISAPLGQLSQLAGTYNFQGFACSVSGVADVTGNAACGTNYGTISIDSAGALTKCNQGDITDTVTHPCVSPQTRSLHVVATAPGVFDIRNAGAAHVGWFFAAIAANGQKVAVMDNDDATTPSYGHAVLSTYASATSGVVSGNYFKNDNEGAERRVTISGGAHSNDLGFSGTITYNSPWTGLSRFNVASGVSVSGIVMTGGTGVYTHLIDTDPQFFASGLKY
ncbi:MAG: hypothetical protein V1879_04885 [Pseudomonadota bacterium]